MPAEDSPRPLEPVTSDPRTPVPRRTLAPDPARWWGRGLFVLAGLCAIACTVLTAQRGDDCVGDPDTEAYRACQASAHTVQTWINLTAGTALIAGSLGLIVKATDSR